MTTNPEDYAENLSRRNVFPRYGVWLGNRICLEVAQGQFEGDYFAIAKDEQTARRIAEALNLIEGRNP